MATVDCKCRWALLVVGILAANCLFSCSAFVHAAPGSSGEGDEAKKKDLRDKGLILVKIWCLVILFAVTFAGGISPYFLRWNQSFLALGTQFAGGVFLGTALMHFLSDSNQTFQDLGLKEYPMAFMLCSLGYILTMLADCVLLWVNQKNSVGNDCVKGKDAAEEESGGGGGERRRGRRAWAGESALLILALCFHSVFEGMAVGVAESKSGAWRALWTVCLHKVFAATAMAMALLRMKPNRPFFSCMAYAFAFGISSPVGVSIGIIVDSTTEGPVARWLFAITMGLATGIFIYVALHHMLRGAHSHAHAQASGNNSSTAREEDDGEGDDRHGPSLYNFLAFLLGVAVIAVAMIWDT